MRALYIMLQGGVYTHPVLSQTLYAQCTLELSSILLDTIMYSFGHYTLKRTSILLDIIPYSLGHYTQYVSIASTLLDASLVNHVILHCYCIRGHYPVISVKSLLAYSRHMFNQYIVYYSTLATSTLAYSWILISVPHIVHSCILLHTLSPIHLTPGTSCSANITVHSCH